MKNKIYLKRTIIKILITSLLFISLFTIINYLEYQTYLKNYNKLVISISNSLKEKYPNITSDDIYKIITKENLKDNIFSKYGYDVQNESLINDNNTVYNHYLILKIMILILLIILLTYLFLKYNKNKDNELKKITNLIDKINHKIYEINIEELNEDELSILKNEIYKTTIMLKESAENSLNDKINLKKSLEDISHQIRTPLTSIIINIDNIIDNSNLTDKQKDEFLRKIKREAYSIKTLIESLLKLSKFDVNSIKYIRKEILIKELINNSIDNVLPLADLKNIKININGDNSKLLCDSTWEVEAITNILKNAIEHSYENSDISVNYKSNKIYTKIEIINKGKPISKKDQKHIFERFYKGEGSSNDSFGIGLALAKAIINEDNGQIYVESKNNETKFIIKYFK